MATTFDDSAFLAAIARLETEIPKIAAAALEKFADALLAKAVPDAPVLTGELRRSARRKPAVHTGNRVEVEVSFNTPYARKQEETVWYRHPRGGKAHYLRDNVRDAGDPATVLGAEIGSAIETLWRA